MLLPVLALLAFAAWLGVGYVAADRLTVPPRRFDPAQHPGSYGSPAYRDVTLTTRDGVDIAAWHLPVPGSDAAVVMVHGHTASRTWEFQQSFPALAVALQANGYHVVMIDLRAHGASGGERLSFGHLERLDVMAAALWADSSYADIRPLIEARWPGDSGLPMAFLRAAQLAHRLRFGFDLGGVRPEAEIGRVAPRPIQLVHGTGDATVPIAHAQRLAAAAVGAGLWTLPGVPHVGAYPRDPDGYTLRVVEFFDQALRVKAASARR